LHHAQSGAAHVGHAAKSTDEKLGERNRIVEIPGCLESLAGFSTGVVYRPAASAAAARLHVDVSSSTIENYNHTIDVANDVVCD
jgi:hypothetical protein